MRDKICHPLGLVGHYIHVHPFLYDAHIHLFRAWNVAFQEFANNWLFCSKHVIYNGVR